MKLVRILKKIKILKLYISLEAYPNPFNSFIVFKFVLEYDSHVLLDIYDINGKHVNNLFNNFTQAGKD